MLTWTDDNGIAHRALANSVVTTACGAPIQSHEAAATFAVDHNGVVTCVWCAIGRPRGLEEAIVLGYNQRFNQRFNTRLRNGLDANRTRTPSRKRTKRA